MSHRAGFLPHIEQEDGVVPSLDCTTDDRSPIFEYLTQSQNDQRCAVITQFGDVLTSRSGERTLAEYQIELLDSTPVRRPHYRLSPPKVHF